MTTSDLETPISVNFYFSEYFMTSGRDANKREFHFVTFFLYDRSIFKASMTTSGTQNLISVKRFLSEYDYLWTPKTNTRIFTAITVRRVNLSKKNQFICLFWERILFS